MTQSTKERSTTNTLFILISLVLVLILSKHGCSAGTTISCFTCASRNGSDTGCEDPFNATSSYYTERCKVPKRGRDGLFPAHFCIKLIGTSYTTKEKLTIRWCSLENMDSQCGDFRLSKEFYRGCVIIFNNPWRVNKADFVFQEVAFPVLTCDRDGCNSSRHNQVTPSLTIFVIISVLYYQLKSVS